MRPNPSSNAEKQVVEVHEEVEATPKRKKLLSLPEIGALVLSGLTSLVLILTALTPVDNNELERTYFREVFDQYEMLGKGITVYPSAGAAQYPFGTPLFVISYDQSAPQVQKDRVEDLFAYFVPKLHALSDRHRDYFIEEVYFENPSASFSSLVTHPVPVREKHDRVTEGSLLPNLKMVNDYLNLGELEIPYDLYQMLTIGKRMSIITNSGFNFFVGALSDFWDPQIDNSFTSDPYISDPLYDEAAATKIASLKDKIPITETEIEEVLKLREENGKYFVNFSSAQASSKKELAITFGGLAKGYANDVLEEVFLQEELTQGFLRGGFSSNVALGRFYHPDRPWYISLGSGMVSKKKENNIYAGIIYPDCFRLSNSGGDNLGKSYLIPDPATDEIYLRHHIIDVKTGAPANHKIIDVNVLSNELSSAELDCLTTAFISLPYQESAEIVATLKQTLSPSGNLFASFLTYELTSLSLDPYELLKYPIDFSLHYTSGYEAYLYEFNRIKHHLID
ncbi:MAG: FAD:protein FMN transferase [Bacilli bacterium]